MGVKLIMKQQMKAALIRKYGQDQLEMITVPMPQLGDQDVLVKIHAASINPIDLKTKDGNLKMLLKYHLPLILGSDFAGTIEQVGVKVTRFKVGDQVYGRVQKNRIGTFAEWIAVSQADIARKPANLTFEQAAAIPLVGLTSYQALFDVMKIKRGDKLLIQAGSGGIGTIAIQIAKLAGAYVATTTSSKNAAFVKQLGADEVIDYHKVRFDEVLSDYDDVFDTLGGKQLERAFSIVKPGGKVVSLSGLPNGAFAKSYGLPKWKLWLFKLATVNLSRLEKKSGIAYHFLFMKPSGSQLAILTKLIEQEKIRPIIDRIFEFDDIQAAFNYSQSHRARGKIVVQMIADK